MARILIVYDDIEVQSCAATALKGAFEQVEVCKELTLADGLEKIRAAAADLSLVLVGTQVRPDAGRRTDPADGKPIRAFVRTCMQDFPNLPLLVLSPSPSTDPQLAGLLSAHRNTALLLFDADWAPRLARRAAELVGRSLVRDCALELKIHLYNTTAGSWHLACRGPVSNLSSIGPLQFNEQTLNKALEITADLERDIANTRSLGHLEKLAGTLERLFFTDEQTNRDLWLQLSAMLPRVGGTHNMRVTFTTWPNAMEQVPVEALKDRMESAYWMLQAPVVRQYDTSGGRKPLFEDPDSMREPVNCLIVAADPREGSITDARLGWSGDMKYLGILKRQARTLQGVLQSLHDSDPGCVGKVDLLQLDRDQDPIATVLDKLGSETWHLVHFVGHAVTNASGEGGLVLAATPQHVLPFSGFADKLARTQFLFVSSCRSATPGFFQHAVRNRVPAVLGYRWEVGIFSAYCYASRFYQALFTPGRSSYKSLDYAFLEARKAMHDRWPHEAVWTAPVLITQLREPSH